MICRTLWEFPQIPWIFGSNFGEECQFGWGKGQGDFGGSNFEPAHVDV